MVEFSQAIADEICVQIASGLSLRKVCEASDMPSAEAVRLWLRDKNKADFLGQYARAREEQADYYADAIVEIADTEEDVNKARVRIDARKWVACKLKPKVYGERIAQDLKHTGQIDTIDKTPIELARLLDFAVHKLAHDQEETGNDD